MLQKSCLIITSAILLMTTLVESSASHSPGRSRSAANDHRLLWTHATIRNARQHSTRRFVTLFGERGILVSDASSEFEEEFHTRHILRVKVVIDAVEEIVEKFGFW